MQQLQLGFVEELGNFSKLGEAGEEMGSKVNRLQSVGGTSGTLGISANYFNFLLLTGARSIKRRK